MPARRIADEFPKEFTLEIGGVPCNIYYGEDGGRGYGIKESSTAEGRRATVWFQCYWDERNALIAGLLGTVEYTGSTILRNDPFAYPVAESDDIDDDGTIFPGRLFCTAIASVDGTKPWVDDSGANVGLAGWTGYVFAIVQAEFSSPPYIIDSGEIGGTAFTDLAFQTYTISKIRVSGEVFSPPTGSYVWAAGAFNGQPLLDVGAGQIRTRIELSCTRVRMPLVPLATWMPLIGTVNRAFFGLSSADFPVGSALFMGMNPEPRSDPVNGGIVFDIELCWQVNGLASNTNGPDGAEVPLDWNVFLDPAGAWSEVTTKGGEPVFQYADHELLFDDTVI